MTAAIRNQIQCHLPGWLFSFVVQICNCFLHRVLNDRFLTILVVLMAGVEFCKYIRVLAVADFFKP